MCHADPVSLVIPGFTETVRYTNAEKMNWEDSVLCYDSWKTEFESALKLIQKREDDLAKANRKGGEAGEEMEEQLKEQDMGVNIMLPSPCGWPVKMPDGEFVPGIPPFSIALLVHIQGVFGQESSLSDFRSSFGDLPARATMELTKMMYQEDDVLYDDPSFARRFLPPSRVMSEYDRLVTYTLAMNDMRGFYVAGHHSELLMRNLRYLQDSVQDRAQRVVFYSRYLRDCLRQHRSIVMNGNMRNKHAEFQMKYIVEAEDRLLPDLAGLRSRVFTSIAEEGVTSSNDPLLRDWNSRTCWLMQNPDSFLFFLWEHQVRAAPAPA